MTNIKDPSMNLWYISLHLDYEEAYPDPFVANVNLRSSFISNYLSIKARRLRFKTDNTFNMISVCPTLHSQNVGCKVWSNNVLKVRVLFDKKKYLGLNEKQRNEYSLELLEEGFRYCKKEKNIPLDALLQLLDDFRNSGYKNEWLHKKKRFRERGIEVILNCKFTPLDFRLVMTVNELKEKKELVSGTIIRTLPDEVHFSPLFKDLYIEGEYLVITEYSDRPKLKFALDDIINGKLKPEIFDAGLKYTPYEGPPNAP